MITNMMLEQDVPEGEQTTNVYLIKYEEDLWFRFNEAGREFCKQTWIKKAEPCGVEEVVLQLIPDPVFPGFGKEKPYIEWRHKFPKVPEGEWTEKVTVTVNTNDNRFMLGTDSQARLRECFTKYPKGTRFKVYNLQNQLLWEHTT